MPNFIDLTGQKFNRLSVVSRAVGTRRVSWNCICECGNSKTARSVDLKSGNTQSCGCLNAELASERKRTHGKHGSPIHAIWNNMMARCYNESSAAFKNYGGRGIKVCEQWHTFDGFFADMGDCPAGMTMERKDNDGNYELSNVEWRNRKDQANNRRSNVFLTYQGQTKTVQQWCDELGLNAKTVRRRLNVYGYSVERALKPGWRGRDVCSE